MGPLDDTSDLGSSDEDSCSQYLTKRIAVSIKYFIETSISVFFKGRRSVISLDGGKENKTYC
jgi:hypothetical protein